MTAVPITLAKLFAWDSLSQAAGRRDDGHEPLIRVRGKSSPCRLLPCQADRSVVMLSPCAGAALDPPFGIIPNKALTLFLSHNNDIGKGGAQGCEAHEVK